MKQYLDQLRHVLEHGERCEDRTGTGTLSVFGLTARYNLAHGFPLVTTKKVFWKAVVGELLWFLEGSTNRNRLEEITFGTVEQNATIWDEWASYLGELGPIYGAQWRSWGQQWDVKGIDQISKLIDNIKTAPDSRRHIVSAWNVDELGDMALPPCHTLWQVRIIGRKMHLQLYQRSADMFLGVPFNIASYALLLRMLAHVTGYEAGEFIHTIGDAHIYLNHGEQVREQLSRELRPLPSVYLNQEVTSVFDFKMSDILLDDYDPHPAIKAEVAV